MGDESVTLDLEGLSPSDSITSHSHFTIQFMLNIKSRTSAAVNNIEVDPIRGYASVEFSDGSVYDYTHVSRRAIANLLLNPNMSLGFWVNANCLDSRSSRVTCYA